jgi:hypothetical protein
VTPGRLYTLTRQDIPDLPSGIRITLPSTFSFSNTLTDGETVDCRAGIIRFGNANFKVDLREAITWNAKLGLAKPPPLPTLLEAWAFFIENSNLAPLINGNAPVFRPLELLKLGSTKDIEKTLSRFFGRGPGLTPAGDDFIVGYLAGYLASHGHALNLNLDRRSTSDISFSTLFEATQGYFSQPILNLIESLRQADPLKTRTAILENLAMGATSGTAGAMGIFAAFPALNTRKIFD